MNFENYLQKTNEIGYVTSVETPVVFVEGLPEIKLNELVLFESGDVGQAISLTSTGVDIMLFSNRPIEVGMRVTRTTKYLEIDVTQDLAGKIVSPFLGGDILSMNMVEPNQQRRFYNINSAAPTIASRVKITEPLITGVSIVDLLIPLGRGQRQLIIGDRKTGKSAFALQTLLSQKHDENIICIYACIGKKKSEVHSVHAFLKNNDLLSKTVVVASYADDPAPIIFITPYSAMTLAEYYRDAGKNVIIVIDDLTTHAMYYREISLLAKRFPGRNSYPGDIFYTHSKLLERAGNFLNGTITCLPIAATIEGDISGYIQTNLMSMTDGHIFFDKELYNEGLRPAINHYYSVTRVGRQTQTNLRWSVSRELTSFFSLYSKTKNFIHFGAELNQGIKYTMQLGERLQTFFNQRSNEVLDINIQIILICVLWGGVWSNKSLDEIQAATARTVRSYNTQASFKETMDKIVAESPTLNDALGKFMKEYPNIKQYL